MRRARLLRATIFIAIPTFVAIPVIAVASGQTGLGLGVSLLAAILIVPLLWTLYRENVRLCFPTGVALELHPKHLVVAAPQGMLKIPRSEVVGIKDPHYSVSHSVPSLHIDSTAEIEVGDAYKVTTWLGFRRNPIVWGAALASASEWDAMSALRSWHAAIER